MGLDLYADVYWGIQVDKEVIDVLLTEGISNVEEVSLDSSMIHRAKYNSETCSLKLEFSSGSWYQYSDVPSEIFRKLTTAKSAGSYFNRNIKDQYSSEVCEDGDDDDESSCESIEEIEEKESVKFFGYREGRDYFGDTCDGYIIGFERGSFYGFGPSEFDPTDYVTDRTWTELLEKFCEKYKLGSPNPRWWIYVRSSV